VCLCVYVAACLFLSVCACACVRVCVCEYVLLWTFLDARLQGFSVKRCVSKSSHCHGEPGIGPGIQREVG